MTMPMPAAPFQAAMVPGFQPVAMAIQVPMSMGPMPAIQHMQPTQAMAFQQAVLVPVAALPAMSAVSMCASMAPTAPALSSTPSSECLDLDHSFSRSTTEGTESELSDLDGASGRVWDLSQRPTGCRQVQRLLDGISDVERLSLAMELRGRISVAARSACANYVLQKLIQVLRPQACQFIIDEIMEEPEEVAMLAKHQYACRILQRLLENCQAQQMEGIIRLLLQDALQLVRHNYGTFVLQAVLVYGTESQRHALGEILLGMSMGALGNDENATQVLQKALLHAPQKVALAQRMVPQFVQLARGRHSHQTVLAALQLLPHQEADKAIKLLSHKVQKLWASRYGRLVVKSIPSLHQKCEGITRREAASA